MMGRGSKEGRILPGATFKHLRKGRQITLNDCTAKTLHQLWRTPEDGEQGLLTLGMLHHLTKKLNFIGHKQHQAMQLINVYV